MCFWLGLGLVVGLVKGVSEGEGVRVRVKVG